MRKTSFPLLLVVVSCAVASAQMGEALREPQPNFSNAIVGSAVTCSQPHALTVPQPLLEKAKLKARLLVLLHDSLLDDASGIVNIAREKEIRKLAAKLRSARVE